MLAGATLLISVVPSHAVRDIFTQLKPYVGPDSAIVSATKGIETGTCLVMSEVIRQVLGREAPAKIAALSGPTFAMEVARGDPTAAVVACDEIELARRIQAQFSGRNLRLYYNSDLVGTQICGAAKNIIAIAAGIVHGLGFGYNTSAGLITRGLSELKRLCLAAGGNSETPSGLAGLGDLVLTCTGALSRNRSLGVELGKGRTLEEILSGARMVAEGVRSTQSTHTLASRLEVEMPITEQMQAVLYQGKKPLAAIRDLMERGLKGEFAN